MNPVTIQNNTEELSIDHDETGSKVFICGLEKDFPTPNSARKFSYTESTRRRKRMKSTTGILACLNY